MGRHIYLFGLAWLLIKLSACSDQVAEAPVVPGQNSLDQAKAYYCQTVFTKPDFIPIDCYAWGQTEYPGDNLSLDYQAIQAWWQAVSLNPNTQPDSNALIEIDFAMLIEVDTANKLETVIGFLDYDSDYPKFLSLNEGGSFSRWYTDNSSLHLSNAVVEDGLLKIRPAIFPERVSHWWLNSTGKYRRRSDCSYHLKCRLRISGAIALQMAADYYKTVASNWPDNKEAFHSPWYGDTEGAFKIICYPPR